MGNGVKIRPSLHTLCSCKGEGLGLEENKCWQLFLDLKRPSPYPLFFFYQFSILLTHGHISENEQW